jgi:methionine synthase I (cobalamin-dependent)/5,10-methylenetetrahydrofolate reductase
MMIAMDQTFYDRLAQGPVLADGAMGTELQARRNFPMGICFEHLNLVDPDLVRKVHLDYLEAGAELIETNTYGANRFRLEQYGLADSVEEINRTAVELVRGAQTLTGQRVWIAGAVGPLGKPVAPLWPDFQAEARRVFEEQIGVLVKAGVDVIMLETYTSLAEILEAISAAKAVGDVPVVAQLTFTEDGQTPAGDTPYEVMKTLGPLGLAAIGANCSVGSEHMLRVVEDMASHSGDPMCALPNAGFPSYVDGRFVYFSSPSYMADYARRMLELGVAIVGGCCGTTPAHVSAMRDMLPRYGPKPKHHVFSTKPAERRVISKNVPTTEEDPTGLAKKLGKQFLVTVEVHPPRGFNVDEILRSLGDLLTRVRVDAFNATDSPLAQGRMSAFAMSTLIQSRLGVEAILHIATRYRNLLALHSDLMGAHSLGVRNVFVFMGDPPSIGDYPQSISFSDVTSSGLIRFIKQANAGLDIGGRPVEHRTSFLVGCALNMEAPDLDKEFRSLERKVDAGADFILSQAVFDPEAVELCYQRLGGFPLPLIMGLLPLRNSRHAEFLHNEVPQMVVPEWVRARMRQDGHEREGSRVGVKLAQDLLEAVKNRIAGVYIIPAFGSYDAAAEVLSNLNSLT